MADVIFTRLAEVINKKETKRVASITVTPTVTDCSGTIWFTDLMLQEGPALTGYAPHTENVSQNPRMPPCGLTASCAQRKL